MRVIVKGIYYVALFFLILWVIGVVQTGFYLVAALVNFLVCIVLAAVHRLTLSSWPFPFSLNLRGELKFIFGSFVAFLILCVLSQLADPYLFPNG